MWFDDSYMLAMRPIVCFASSRILRPYPVVIFHARHGVHAHRGCWLCLLFGFYPAGALARIELVSCHSSALGLLKSFLYSPSTDLFPGLRGAREKGGPALGLRTQAGTVVRTLTYCVSSAGAPGRPASRTIASLNLRLTLDYITSPIRGDIGGKTRPRPCSTPRARRRTPVERRRSEAFTGETACRRYSCTRQRHDNQARTRQLTNYRIAGPRYVACHGYPTGGEWKIGAPPARRQMPGNC
ncbi:hypothetical protein BD626DRAFT_217120 [Schizophyllum amplum]|uniref:Uncharacterized protein n=1 Tax=Schizophyllum amplum TaxID=97359 RepID=A0A550CKK4_9AGAR|nr:hypothetical protein BD626DRAFT_217120 [Auriculariopsis ampla]